MADRDNSLSQMLLRVDDSASTSDVVLEADSVHESNSRVHIFRTPATRFFGRQEGYPACKKLDVGLLVVMI